MNKLITFYKNVVTSLGLVTTKDGFIKTPTDQLFTIGGLSLVLPTKEHIDTVVTVNDDGEPVIGKVLFNVLNEDVIQGDTLSLKTSKNIIEKKLAHTIAATGELLLLIASDPKYQKDTSMELNKFLMSLNKITNTQIKEKVDPKSVDLWNKMYHKSLEIDGSDKLGKLFMKKSGAHQDKKWNRLSTFNLPIYGILKNADKDVSINGVKLRNKDITVFELVHEHIFGGMMSDAGTIDVGSDNLASPGFISLYTLYHNMATRLNKVLKSVKFVDAEGAADATLLTTVKLKELEDLDIFKRELAVIPNEVDSKRKRNKITTSAGAMDKILNQTASKPNTLVTGNEHPLQQNNIVRIDGRTNQQTPVVVNTTPAQDTDVHPVHKMMYNGNPVEQSTINNSYAQQQNRYQPQQLMNNNQVVSTYGGRIEPMNPLNLTINQPMQQQNNIVRAVGFDPRFQSRR